MSYSVSYEGISVCIRFFFLGFEVSGHFLPSSRLRDLLTRRGMWVLGGVLIKYFQVEWSPYR